MPRVSVVVPAFNAAPFLADTLRSVTASDYSDYEVIVVDDGSTDDTATIAAGFAPRVRVLQQANQGMSVSRNVGISASDSEFIALLDSDDLWHPEKMSLQTATLDANPGYGLCYSGFTPWHGEAEAVRFTPHPSQELDPRLSGWIYPWMVLTNFVLPSSAMMRRTLWEKQGVFLCEDHQTDDWEYLVRASRSFPFARLKASLVLYRQHPDSLSRLLPRVNKTELMREALIARYGMECPHGGPVDEIEFALRRYLGQRNFANAHLTRGDLLLGIRHFASLLKAGPRRGATLNCLIRSGVRRVLTLKERRTRETLSRQP